MQACPLCGEPLERLTPFCPQCAGSLAAHAATATFADGSRDLHLRASAPPSSPAPGVRFEAGTLLSARYRIVGLLGRGGMGEVYRADDLKLGQPVALKLLPEGFDRDGVRLERFLAEIRTARQVSHPNVCRVYDVGELGGRHFLSMEYVDGEDLAALLRRIGRLPHDKALEIARQVCAGLAASHDRGVVHRDLKPANVMLDGRGKVRITDFGLATALGTGADAEVAGTPAYMAPEQLQGGTISPQTDLYALGLLLFELFTGRRVHDVRTFAELRERHERPPSAALSSGSGDVDPAVLRVIERCLEQDPARRPPHAIAVAAALPGGDPLAAALAAGETPSPQMVAAAGDNRAMSPRLVLAGVATLVAMLAVAIAVNGQLVSHRFIPVPHSPEVLRVKADDLLARLGYAEPPGDAVDGFVMRPDFLTWSRGRRPDVDPRPALPGLVPSSLTFWRHTSGSPIAGDWIGFMGDGPARFAARAAMPRRPPRSVAGIPGDALIELAPDGRLVRLEVASPVRRADATGAPEPDWRALFTFAGLDLSAFTPASPTHVSTEWTDTRRAWVETSPQEPEQGPLRIEAGARAGRVTYFNILGSWELEGRGAGATAPLGMIRALVTMYIGIVLLGIAMAYRNVRLGRSDRRGAVRLAAVTGMATFAATLLATHNVPTVHQVGIVNGAAAFGLYIAATTWIFYVALEPFVRRRWPQALIGWTRLLAGGWRDPLVGRELLIGTAAGCVLMSLILGSQLFVERWAGQWSMPMDLVDSAKWLALATAAPPLYTAAMALAGAPFFALMGLFILFVMRVIFRSATLAAAAYVLVLSLLFIGASPNPGVTWPFEVAAHTISVVLLTRYGFLAYAAAALPQVFVSMLGLSFNFDVFFVPSMLAGMALALAPGLLGAYTALGGVPLFGRWLEESP